MASQIVTVKYLQTSVIDSDDSNVGHWLKHQVVLAFKDLIFYNGWQHVETFEQKQNILFP